MNANSILDQKGREVFAVHEGDSLREAAQVLDKHRIGAAVVTGEDGKVCGVLSERDISRQAARQGSKALKMQVGECMSRNVITAAPADTVDELLARMTDRRIRHLPVMDGGQLVGVISIGDVVKRKIADTEAEAEAMKAYIAAG